MKTLVGRLTRWVNGSKQEKVVERVSRNRRIEKSVISPTERSSSHHLGMRIYETAAILFYAGRLDTRAPRPQRNNARRFLWVCGRKTNSITLSIIQHQPNFSHISLFVIFYECRAHSIVPTRAQSFRLLNVDNEMSLRRFYHSFKISKEVFQTKLNIEPLLIEHLALFKYKRNSKEEKHKQNKNKRIVAIIQALRYAIQASSKL